MNLNLKAVGSSILKSREAGIVIFILVFFLIIGAINPAFIQSSTINRMLLGSLILLFVTVGEMIVILTGGIDISVGGIVGLSAAIGGSLLNKGYSLETAIFASLMVGLFTGSINGLGIGFGEIPAILMTLGTMGVFRGLMMIYTKGRWIQTIPRWYQDLENITFIHVSIFLWFAIFLVLIIYLFLKKAKTGKYLYAVGDNKEGAILAGIPHKAVIYLAYVISGILSSIAALIFVSQFGSVPNQTGIGLELKAIAAAVLGGVSLSGGVGNVIGAALGAVFLTAIDNSLVFLKVPGYWNNAIAGFILLLILVANSQITLITKKKITLTRS